MGIDARSPLNESLSATAVFPQPRAVWFGRSKRSQENRFEPNLSLRGRQPAFVTKILLMSHFFWATHPVSGPIELILFPMP
ncbi:MAG: hypothetical protein ACRC8Y_16915 [Chroococcales cyanobacterium]